jgi:starch synthase (maltosyl-transferring)
MGPWRGSGSRAAAHGRSGDRSLCGRLVADHRDWIAFDSAGAVIHPACEQDGNTVEWVDLAKFDHHSTADPEGLYQYCLKVVRHLLGLGFEGFRCDAAYRVPAELWRRLIADTQKDRPRTVFVASIAFPESHDTPRLADEMNGNPNASKLWYLFTASFSAGCLMPVGFEFGSRRSLDVVSTRPEYWETTSVDLREFIAAVNRLKAEQPIFSRESSMLLLPSSNPAVLIMWQGSATLGQEALLFFNTDFWHDQYVEVSDLRAFVQSGQPLVDVSPEFRMDYVAVAPFSYQLRPGQGVVLVTRSPRGSP